MINPEINPEFVKFAYILKNIRTLLSFVCTTFFQEENREEIINRVLQGKDLRKLQKSYAIVNSYRVIMQLRDDHYQSEEEDSVDEVIANYFNLTEDVIYLFDEIIEKYKLKDMFEVDLSACH